MENPLTDSASKPLIVFVCGARKRVKLLKRANPDKNIKWWGRAKVADAVEKHLEQALEAHLFITESDDFGKLSRVALESWQSKGLINQHAQIITLPAGMCQHAM